MRGALSGALLLAASAALAAAVFMPPIAVRHAMPDLIAVLDITQSMNVTDATIDGRPASRLAFAKRALIDALDRLPCGSKLGLGVFTEYRTFLLFLPVETCSHRRELADDIDGINGRMAWAGDSQIAKGLYSALRLMKTLQDPPALAFITDGHEAPPISARHRIDFKGETGVIRGLLIGVGGDAPQPIPKVDPEGYPAGVWAANEVMQADIYSVGRQGNEAHEMMAETEPEGPVPAALRGTPGSEQLSALHEPYLKLLASETQLGYARLLAVQALGAILHGPATSQPRTDRVDLRWAAALAALLALVARYVEPRRRVLQCPA